MENGNTGEQSRTTWEEMASVPQYWLSLSLWHLVPKPLDVLEMRRVAWKSYFKLK